jgi:3-hydroxyacyl-CoA dehydrogenase
MRAISRQELIDMAIRKVGVLGCGLMGSGIAQVAAQAGYDVVVREVEQKFLDKGLGGIQKSLSKFVEKGKMQQSDMDACMGRLKGSTELGDLADCDIIIEAIIENAQLKKDTYAQLDKIVKPEAIFASNTSSLTVTELSMATARPKQFVGLHFFNPVQLMKLVEVVRTGDTSDEVFAQARAFGEACGKTPIGCKDTPGFVVNRLLVPYMSQALQMLERGDASAADIDTAMKLGCGYPMGPIELTDYVGLDTTLFILQGWVKTYPNEPAFEIPAVLEKKVKDGKLGRKTGEGFYKWEGDKKA